MVAAWCWGRIRAAVNVAVRERLIGDVPARYVELRPARRPHAMVRTDDQIRVWRRTGVRPVVATWTLAGRIRHQPG
jgi:hypothetical protein